MLIISLNLDASSRGCRGLDHACGEGSRPTNPARPVALRRDLPLFEHEPKQDVLPKQSVSSKLDILPKQDTLSAQDAFSGSDDLSGPDNLLLSDEGHGGEREELGIDGSRINILTVLKWSNPN